jgi:hypothetical protein
MFQWVLYGPTESFAISSIRFYSKIFRTGASNYTAVVLARSTNSNRPNCEFRVLLLLLRRLHENLRRRRPEHWLEQTWLLHHDNAPPHTSRSHPNFLARYKMTVIPHPPHSPHLAPCDIFLFPKTKLKLKGRRFDTIEQLQAEWQTVLDSVTERGFQGAFQKWRGRWDRCVHVGGNCFEGDGSR